MDRMGASGNLEAVDGIVYIQRKAGARSSGDNLYAHNSNKALMGLPSVPLFYDKLSGLVGWFKRALLSRLGGSPFQFSGLGRV